MQMNWSDSQYYWPECEKVVDALRYRLLSDPDATQHFAFACRADQCCKEYDDAVTDLNSTDRWCFVSGHDGFDRAHRLIDRVNCWIKATAMQSWSSDTAIAAAILSAMPHGTRRLAAISCKSQVTLYYIIPQYVMRRRSIALLLELQLYLKRSLRETKSAIACRETPVV